MAGFGRMFEANAGRNEVVCKTVLEHRAGRLLVSSHQKGVRHVEVAHWSYCACNRSATCFGANDGPFGRESSHRAKRRAKLRCRDPR
jgi:hypothetical protein